MEREIQESKATVLLGNPALFVSMPNATDGVVSRICSTVEEATSAWRTDGGACLISTRRDAREQRTDGMIRTMLRHAPRMTVALIVGDRDADDQELPAIANAPTVHLLDEDDPALHHQLRKIVLRSDPQRRLIKYADRLLGAIPGIAGEMAARVVRNAEDPILLSEIVDDLGTSGSTLRRKARRSLHCTADSWVSEARLLAALIRLESTGLTAEQVALRGKWSGTSALGRAFRRSHGQVMRAVCRAIGAEGHFERMLSRSWPRRGRHDR